VYFDGFRDPNAWSRRARVGHLGLQLANKLAFRTVAIARGADNQALSRKLGAHHFIDNATQDVAGALNALGGARAVLTTVTRAKAMASAIDGLAVRGPPWRH
jgi:alcohol dehydrogenase